MQVLWSRTAQATSCKCAHTALVRGAATKIPKARRKYGDAFSAFSTAVLATVVIDAKLKNDRRNQWDQLIAEAKDEAASISTCHQHSDKSSDLVSYSPVKIQHGSELERQNEAISSERHAEFPLASSSSLSKNSIVDRVTFSPNDQKSILMQRLELLDSHLRQCFTLPQIRNLYEETGTGVEEAVDLGMSLDSKISLLHEEEANLPKKTSGHDSALKARLNSFELSEDMNRDEADNRTGLGDVNREFEMHQSRQVHTPHFMKVLEKIVAELVAALLLNTRTFSEHNRSKSDDIDRFISSGQNLSLSGHNTRIRESMWISKRWKDLEAGLTQDTRCPSFSQPTSRYEWDLGRHELNSSIESILAPRVSRPASMEVLIIRVCYNLLISPTPPSIDTYNNLIKRLNGLGDHGSATIVIHSLLKRCHFRPNTQTFVSIIEHYRLTRDSKGFRTFIKQLGQQDVGRGSGIGLRRIHQSQPSRNTYMTLLTEKWRLANGYFWMKAKRDVPTFQAIIYGSLELMGLKDALRYFKAAMLEGALIHPEVFVMLARECLTAQERSLELCIVLLRNFLSYWRQSSFTPNLITTNTIARDYILNLIDKIDIRPDNFPPPLMRKQKHIEGRGIPFFPPDQCFAHMIRQMKLEDCEAELKKIDDVLPELITVFDGCTSTLLQAKPLAFGESHVVQKWVRSDFWPAAQPRSIEFKQSWKHDHLLEQMMDHSHVDRSTLSSDGSSINLTTFR